ncbi:hypothetical protein [Methylobrevis pamukkalensis]|uniref:DUF1127 domain-containing protein n=1 Tax=Methylobrevis pamukkalensis TaxID=1439726 RepID=A0A1E3H088_9HYPH|nr:hypothetical protein [Methylobrevis pamukkalensis]ODN69236.1 hypothetical protein A6302_03457 [Methylobrevis pamukkalensis]
MSTRTDPARPTTRRLGGGIFRRTFEAMLGARERQAHWISSRYLSALDAETLASLGYDEDRIRRLLRHGSQW